ncbi:hypothetical protein [Streptomyces sp. NPDC050504]|uniref:hypothetical protein n=1 Tax=Streptomyces sp. NPDC050504 TaxID=3365618 RepID=UPI0037A80741
MELSEFSRARKPVRRPGARALGLRTALALALAGGALAAPGTALAADGRDPAAPPRTTSPAPAGAPGPVRLANGDLLDLPASGGRGDALRVTGEDGGQPGRYAFARLGDQVDVRPVAGKRPLASTRLTKPAGRPARLSAAAPSAPLAAAAGAYRVDLRLTGAENYHNPLIHVWNRRTWTYFDVAEEQWYSRGTVTLPPGDYVAVGLFSNWQRPDLLLTKAFTVKDRALSVPLDAKAAKETGIVTDDPGARRSTSAVWIRTPRGSIAGFAGGWGNKVYVTPFAVPGASLRVHDVLLKSGATAHTPSPYRYDLYHSFNGTVPASPVAKVVTANLAKTLTTVRAQGADTTGHLASAPVTGEDAVLSPTPLRVPGTVTEYVTPGQPFHRSVSYGNGRFDADVRTLPRGTSPGETFGAAPLEVRPHPLSGAYRGRAELAVYEPTTFSDGAGHLGTDSDARYAFRLASGGVTLAEGKELRKTAFWTAKGVPLPRARYELTHTVERHAGHARLSSRQTTEWGFDSDGYQPARASVTLPLVDVRLAVDGLDVRNTSGTAPVTVRALAVSRDAAADETLTGLEYSTDDGATWTALPLPDASGDPSADPSADPSGALDRASVALDVPQDARFVSLRASAKDAAGSTVRRTLMRAFAGPAARTVTDEATGGTKVSKAVVNGGKPVVPQAYDLSEYPVTFTVTDPAGVADAYAYLYKGAYARPSAVLDVWRPTCAKAAGAGAAPGTYTCTTVLTLDVLKSLGRNDLAGEWKVAVGARSLDGRGRAVASAAGTARILRATRLTVSAPATAVRNRAFTVTGRATVLDWATGTFRANAAQAVKLEVRARGTQRFSTSTTAKSAATGALKATPKAVYDGHWRWLLARTAGADAAVSPLSFVDVR